MRKASRFTVATIVLASLLIVLAQQAQASVTDDGGRPGSGVLTTNALTSNALTSNALTSNALTSNALTSNALTSNALTSNALFTTALDDPTQGANAAMVIKYSVRCMLTPEQSVTVTYRNAANALVTETYFGNIGIQPDWANEGLNESDRLWWAACLGAHVNNFERVSISVRSNPNPALVARGEERQLYYAQEGAIWATYDPAANPPLHFYSCQGVGYAPKLTSRHCIANEGCGSMFTYLGYCSPAVNGPCQVQSGQPGESGNLDRCHTTLPPWADDPSRHVITVFLKYD